MAKTVTDDIVNAVINGDYGTGDAQKEALTQEGYDYDEVQSAVSNRIANSSGTTAVSPDTPASSSGTSAISGNSITYSSSGKPTYTNIFKTQLDEVNNQLLNYGAFDYDYTTDDTYKQYEKEYTRQGEIAMKDTLGQVAARTGGLASSYAEAAAQQQYGSYMSELASKIPELEQIAYNMYLNDYDMLSNKLSTLLALEQNEYSRYQSELSDWYNQQELALQYAALAQEAENQNAAQMLKYLAERGEGYASMTDLSTLNALGTQNSYGSSNAGNTGNSTTPSTTSRAMTELSTLNSTNTYLNEALKKSAPDALNYLEGLVDRGVLTEEGAFNLWNEYVYQTPTTSKELIAKTGNKNLIGEGTFSSQKVAGLLPNYDSYEAYAAAVWNAYINDYLGSYRYYNETNDRSTAVNNQYRLGLL